MSSGEERGVISEVGNGGVGIVGNTVACNGGVGVAGDTAIGNSGIAMADDTLAGDGGTTTGETAICVGSVAGMVLVVRETGVGMTAGCWASPVGVTTGANEATGDTTTDAWRAGSCAFVGTAGEVPPRDFSERNC